MTDLMRPIVDQLSKLWGRVDHMPVVRWGAVTSVAPLLVLLDGAPGADPLSPQSTVAGLKVGDRVACVEQHRRVIVVGRAGGVPSFAIGEYRHGLWTSDTVPAGTLPADGSVHDIADWPLLAAHFETVFGTVNHFGGDGIDTFGMPDSRERVAVNQGGGDIFSVLGDATGAKTHEHPLSDAGAAKIFVGTSNIAQRRVATAPWTRTQRAPVSPENIGGDYSEGVGLTGVTDAGSSIQPSFVVRVAIQAV